MTISPSILHASTGQTYNLSQDFASGLATGAFSKICVNNLNKSISNYQLGASRIADRSLTTMRGQLIGAGVQSSGLFLTKSALQSDNDSAARRSFINMTAGAIGGLAMSPACVPFFYKGAEPYRIGRTPITNAMVHMLKHEPHVFTRGLIARGICTALEFGIYFSLKENTQRKTGRSEVCLAEKASFALPAILAAMPFHQVYIQQMNTGEDIVSAMARYLKKEPHCALGNRHVLSYVLFVASAMTEIMIIDGLKKSFDSALQDGSRLG